MNENAVTLELATDPAEISPALAYDRRLKRNLDYLNAHWDDLRPRECGRSVAVVGQELFIADTYQEAMDLARAAHPDDDAAWCRCVPMMNENLVMFDVETDPEQLARSREQDQRAERNSDWLQAHWPDLLPQARGRFLTVAGQEAFIADTPEESWAMARAAHPEDVGALGRYVFPNQGPRIYANRWIPGPTRRMRACGRARRITRILPGVASSMI
jgi:uncharacterized protein YbdZ (MbtH family)